METKGVKVRDSTILWTLHSRVAEGNDDLAYNFLLAISDASEGIISPYNPTTRLRGAVNRQSVTCYLDSTLFAMFSRLGSFEAMLYNTFADLARQKLSFLLRLWVNMLRTGQLITVDVTERIQASIAECGWQEAAELHQQDASEAFSFITGKLELPLLTLKMDIYHSGKEDTADDHKFINERLLEVAIPENPDGEQKEITLEECLEEYFNNRVEVRRYLERRTTMNSMKSPVDGKLKAAAIHVETMEIDPDSSPITPIASTPSGPLTRPPARPRQQSIIQERYAPARTVSSGTTPLSQVDTDASGRSRAGSLRKTVMMPGWQFFSLIPWYTDNTPSNDAQVAAHFSSVRPVLGLCLKRYTFQNGRPARLGTYVDIPVEIGLPHFIQEDHMEDGTNFGNFKLSLQSVVCHRGESVDSGHYIALVRGTTRAPENVAAGDTKHWLRFDDLAPQRITLVDIHQALREETPYLLFYQILPIDEASGSRSDTEASEAFGDPSSTSLPLSRVSTTGLPSGRPSLETTGPNDSRGRSPNEESRASIVSFSETAAAGSLAAPSPPSNGQSRKGSTASHQRSVSKGSDGGSGLGRTLSKLTKRRSREVPRNQHHETEPAKIQVQEITDLTPETSQVAPVAKPNTLAVTTTPGHSGRSHKRDSSKGKNRLSKHGGKDKDLDRECIVM
ncbi:uncharacterized protein HMPREF1541_04692 [Cyphellophora europaea CBS 101466]|uniref:ubiquitinyl hydrolase 1 n=1 Tax=Cyphellophora europaea (strain CBS 101466) TaxID=1220924 RepID=W2RVT6_CYPE1|nr:uncharacterized protein HMPREF1541_04692 [Cyphellophora europaea CBS 101466]ETN40415.1 hypothetical protein HMPREF1541_04692 [Cyphellophora europaea CBS 101466]